MAFNGSGTFTLVAGNPVVTGTTISSTWANNTLSDMATGLSTCLTKDGQTTPTANIPMGGFKITGSAVASAGTDLVTYDQVGSIQQAQNFTYFTTGGSTTAYTLTPSPAIGSLVAGQRFNVKFNAANTTTSPTLAVSGLTAAPLKIYDALGAKTSPIVGSFSANMDADVFYDGTDYVVLDQLPVVPRSAIAGLTLSTAGSSTTMSIAAGQAADSTNAVLMALVSAMTKTTSSWAVGSATGGKSETGAAANNTWYHWYEIRRPDTGIVDLCFSTSATGLVAADYVAGGGNVANAYTQFRRIGSWRTNGSAQWESILQDGDYFQWLTIPLDVNATNPGTSAVTRTLSVPTGVNVMAEMNANLLINTAAAGVLLSDLATVDTAPSFTAAPLATFFSVVTASAIGVKCTVRTNTSAQIRSRLSASDASSILRIATTGWFDRRGRDA